MWYNKITLIEITSILSFEIILESRMRTLYLLGNGFDLAHNIETSYSSFRAFLAEKHESFLTQFESMYHIQPLDDTEPWYTEEAQKRWDEHVMKDLWKCFEEDIGNPDVDGMHDAAESLIDVMPRDGIKDTLDYYWKDQYGFVLLFQKYAFEWLKTVNTSKATIKKRELFSNNSDLFISFNYTDTLESVYGINNALHIHGGIPSCSTTPPIMGHGNKRLIDSYRRQAKEAQKEFREWDESICNAIADYCETLYKDTERIISLNSKFFSCIKDIDRIVCLGLSFGDVDVPYLNRIQQEIKPRTKWIVYYYNSIDHNRMKDIFGILGISRKYEVSFLQSDSFWDA